MSISLERGKIEVWDLEAWEVDAFRSRPEKMGCKDEG